MTVRHAANILEFQQVGETAGLGGFDLTFALPELWGNVGKAEVTIDLALRCDAV